LIWQKAEASPAGWNVEAIKTDGETFRQDLQSKFGIIPQVVTINRLEARL